ncbi:MAG: tetratricopeptide repeat protein [Planctomycetes bacterium]|nr:tetratricopeptide repeat protein [Planctomycetota bacterium]
MRPTAAAPLVKYVAAAALLTTTIAQADEGARGVSRPQLILQLSDAREAFDRGSALLASAPDDAMAAFREARDKFQAVVDTGIENGQLYYNLGNTHLRLGEIGEAIADYRRAQRLTPGDSRLKANLRFARSLRRDHIVASGERALVQTVFFWHTALPARVRASAALVGYGLFWLLLVAQQLWPRARIRAAALVCLALWVVLLVSVATDLPSQSGLTEGVLVADEVVVRKGNGEAYRPQFEEPLHEGVEFKMSELRGDWIHIELADGSQGWVRAHEAELF